MLVNDPADIQATRAWMWVNLRLHTQFNACMYARMHVCYMHTCIHAHIHWHAHNRLHVQTHIYVQTHAHWSTYTYTCTQSYWYAHPDTYLYTYSCSYLKGFAPAAGLPRHRISEEGKARGRSMDAIDSGRWDEGRRRRRRRRQRTIKKKKQINRTTPSDRISEGHSRSRCCKTRRMTELQSRYLQ